MKPALCCTAAIPRPADRRTTGPRRLLLIAAAFVAICVISSPAPCSAEDELDAFLARYQKAIQPVRAAYRHCSYEGRRVIHIPGESDDPRRPKKFRVFAKGDRLRLDLGYPASNDGSATEDLRYTCDISHPEKSFRVRQNMETGKYFLLDMMSDAVSAASVMRRTELAMDAPFSVRGFPVEQFLKHPNIKVTSIVEESEKGWVRLEISVPLEARQVAARNWLLFDAANHMALLEYCVGNFPLTSRVAYKYEDRGGDIPVVIEVNSYEHLNRDSPANPLELTGTRVVEKFDFHDPPEKLFTPAAFGIYERTGFQIRWYVWLFIASVVLLAVRGWFWWRRTAESSGR